MLIGKFYAHANKPFPSFGLFDCMLFANRSSMLLKPPLKNERSFILESNGGFALPLAIGLGLVMLVIAGTSILVAQGDRTTAWQRKESGSSFASVEGGVARTLAQMHLPNNAVLLTRNYDPNTNGGKNYLGPDGVPNTGDETTTNVNEWASYSPSTGSNCGGTPLAAPNITYGGTIGTAGRYTLKAYRYNSAQQTGTFLVEGTQGGSKSYLAITLTVVPVNSDFPGILIAETAYIQGRRISGSNANIYFNPDSPHSGNPGLTASASRSDASRAQYLNAIWSGTSDGFNSDPVDGKLIACRATLTLSDTPPPGTIDKGNLKNSSLNLASTGSGITSYRIGELVMTGNDTLTVDTTAGPVYLYVTEKFHLYGASKILNVRGDGQTPRVGDLRIFAIGGDGYEIGMFGTSCIQKAFIYNKNSDLQIQSTGPGCASGASVEGVVWVEDLLSSRTKSSTRVDPDKDGDITATPSVVSGIVVPDDASSSLSDILSSVGITPQYRFGKIKNWQRTRL
jgi:hypothetical protein